MKVIVGELEMARARYIAALKRQSNANKAEWEARDALRLAEVELNDAIKEVRESSNAFLEEAAIR